MSASPARARASAALTNDASICGSVVSSPIARPLPAGLPAAAFASGRTIFGSVASVGETSSLRMPVGVVFRPSEPAGSPSLSMSRGEMFSVRSSSVHEVAAAAMSTGRV